MPPLPLAGIPGISQLQELVLQRRNKAFLVGGALRDLWLGREGHDLDFAVQADAIDLARRFARRIKGAFILLDADSGCARVAKTWPDGAWTYDFADFRARTLKGDLGRRDFTINTLTLDIADFSFDEGFPENTLDHKHALRDLKARVIRAAAGRTFDDDPLRILRAYSHRAQLGFRIEPATLALMKRKRALIRNVSPERVREELFKVLESPRAAATFMEMDRHGVLLEVLPQVRVMQGVLQGGYHHLNVWEHSLETLLQLDHLLALPAGDELITSAVRTALPAYLGEEIGGSHSRVAVLRLAALLHDIGKPDTRRKEPGGRTSFHGHEHAGRRVARILARQLVLSTKERYALEDMVTHHLRPGYLANFKRPSDKAVFRFFRDTKAEAAAIVLLSVADQRATRGPLTTAHDLAHHQAICRMLLVKFFEKKASPSPARLLTGHDLIRELGLTPGPRFAKILEQVAEAQHLGKVQTKAEALSLAGKIA